MGSRVVHALARWGLTDAIGVAVLALALVAGVVTVVAESTRVALSLAALSLVSAWLLVVPQLVRTP